MKTLRCSFSYLQSSICVPEGEEITGLDRFVICSAWMRALKVFQEEVPSDPIKGGNVCVTLEFQPGTARRSHRQSAFLYCKETLARLGYTIVEATLPQNQIQEDT